MTNGYAGGVGREQVGRRPVAATAEPSLGPVKAAAAAATEAAAEALGGAEGRLADARQEEAVAVGAAQRELAKARSSLGDRLVGGLSDARRRALQAAEQLAAGSRSPVWDATAGTAGPGPLDAARHVRLGDLVLAAGRGSPDNQQIEIPLVLPLLDRGSLVVRGPAGPDVAAVVQGVVLRVLSATGPGQVEVHGFDPAVRATLAPFSPLRSTNVDLFPPVRGSDQELRHLLEELSTDVRRISDLYRGRPFDLGSFRSDTGQPIETYQLVVVQDYPVGTSAETNALLSTLLRTGPACGVSFLIHYDPDAVRPREVDPDAVLGDATVVDLRGRGSCTAFPGFEVRVDPSPPLDQLEVTLVEVVEAAKRAAAPVIELPLRDDASLWTESSRDRITSTFAIAGHQPVDLVLGDDVEQRHNVLVTGAVGQGKSNLLMAIVHDFAQRYAPSELTMYLLDFKDGVTLYPLSERLGVEGWLPHAEVLGLNSDREFGAAVLGHLVAEFDRRARTMKPFGDSLARYRTAQPEAPMPRILVVIDEMQTLFQEDDDLTRQALGHLEQLAKKGRAYGIHLILASQTLSGITTLLAKQDGIFSQFPIRLALKNSAAESRVVLDAHNTEAARLRYRGEVIVNTDFGAVSGNSRAVVLSAEPARMEQLRALLWRKGHGAPPTVFEGEQPTELANEIRSLAELRSRARRPGGSRLALVGRPVAVTSDPIGIPMTPDTGRHLALVGGGTKQSMTAGLAADEAHTNLALGALQAAALSLALQHPEADARFTLLDLLPPDPASRAYVADLAESLGRLGVVVDRWNEDQAAACLADVVGDLDARAGDRDQRGATRYVVGLGLDRARGLADFDLTAGRTPVDDLRRLLREGPALGAHLLAWWGNARTFRDHQGFESSGLVDGLVVFRVAAPEITDLFGPFVSWTPSDNRALLRDASQSGEPVTVVPFTPLSRAGLRRLVEHEWDS